MCAGHYRIAADLESVKVAGDDYPTCPSLLVNGLATLARRHSAVVSNNTLFWAHGHQSVWRGEWDTSILNGVATL